MPVAEPWARAFVNLCNQDEEFQAAWNQSTGSYVPSWRDPNQRTRMQVVILKDNMNPQALRKLNEAITNADVAEIVVKEHGLDNLKVRSWYHEDKKKLEKLLCPYFDDFKEGQNALEHYYEVNDNDDLYLR